ncbi:COG3 Conserved oligomeric Golgi complex subunit 3 [Candida maltosa Xu316]
MTRGRSKSIVQKIANDIPNTTIGDIQVDHHITPHPTAFKLSRSKSFCLDDRCVTEIPGPVTFPFTEKESQDIHSSIMNSYDYDVILRPTDIAIINDLHLDNVLNFQNLVQRNKKQVRNLVHETDDILTQVESLLIKYNEISNDTLDFDSHANQLLDTQASYQEKYDQVNSYLQHFEHLDFITMNLSRSGTHLLKSKKEFFITSILDKLDSSLQFIESHPEFKEAELYGSRFRQCMTRALSLVRNYLVNELKSISDSIHRKLNQTSPDSSSSSVKLGVDLLIYHEYNNYLKDNGSNFNDFTTEISKRSSSHSEYNGLLHDVLSNYFNDRLALLKLYFNKTSTIESLFVGKNDIDLVQTCQDQLYYFEKIIEKEVALFHKFFAPRESTDYITDQLYDFLKNVLEPLYDGVRLIVLKESNISKLCQFTTILQKYYEFDDRNHAGDGDSSIVMNGDSIKYGVLFQPLLDEVQTRLIFRIQKYIDDKLIRFKPTARDLKFGNNISNKAPSEADKINQLDVDYSENFFPDLYLPLGKSLTLLSNIYELINSVVFDDLAHYVVHACIELLKGEFLKLAIAHMGSIDGQLVYLKNLILLRNQINTFDIQYTRTDYTIDFTSGLGDIWNMIKNREFSLSNGFIDLATKAAPKIINNMIDANQEIEIELRNSVTAFINECSTTICQPLLVTSDDPQEAVSKFKDNLITEIPSFYKRIRVNIEDQVVTNFLMNNLSNIIVVTYETYYNKLIETMVDDSSKQQFNDLMEVDTLYGYITDMINQLHEDTETSNVKFNEDILSSLKLEDVAPQNDSPPSPGSKVEI